MAGFGSGVEPVALLRRALLFSLHHAVRRPQSRLLQRRDDRTWGMFSLSLTYPMAPMSEECGTKSWWSILTGGYSALEDVVTIEEGRRREWLPALADGGGDRSGARVPA